METFNFVNCNGNFAFFESLHSNLGKFEHLHFSGVGRGGDPRSYRIYYKFTRKINGNSNFFGKLHQF